VDSISLLSNLVGACLNQILSSLQINFMLVLGFG